MRAVEVKPKKCKAPGCGKHFKPAMTTQKVCSIACAKAMAKDPKLQKVAAKAITRQKREELKERREKLKSKGDHLREAQQAFNAYIRERDRLEGHYCISSGRPLDWNGNAVDAGHYRSVGSAPHLRFNEMNCNAQSKHDNRYLSGNVAELRGAPSSVMKNSNQTCGAYAHAGNRRARKPWARPHAQQNRVNDAAAALAYRTRPSTRPPLSASHTLKTRPHPISQSAYRSVVLMPPPRSADH